MKLLVLMLFTVSCSGHKEVISIDYECDGKKSTHEEAIVYSSTFCPNRVLEAITTLGKKCEKMTISKSFCGLQRVE